MKGPTLYPVVNYSLFYKVNSLPDEFSKLQQYPTKLLILKLAQISAILFYEDNNTIDGQLKVFTEVFSYIESDVRRRVAEIIVDGQRKEHIPIFFSAPPIAKLINLALKNHTEIDVGKETNLSEFDKNLLDSILIANDLYYSRLSVKYDLATYEFTWHLQLMQQYYIRNLSELVAISPVKFLLFYKYMNETFPSGKGLIEEFCKNLKLQSYFQFITLFFDILQKVQDEYKNSGSAKYVLQLREAEHAIIESFAITEFQLKDKAFQGNVHTDLIPKPFYLLKDNQAIILDYHFLMFLFDIALPFTFYNNTSLNKSESFPSFTMFKSFIGKNYYEDYFFKKFLSSIYKTATVILDDTNETITSDFVVITGNDVFVIEVKSVSLNHRVLEQIDISEFKQFLDAQFLQEAKPGKRNKGIFQLINQISNLASKTSDKLQNRKFIPKKVNVFPIVVYTDNALNTAGVNSYLNDTFETRIENFRNNFKHIYPLTAININFFIRYYSKLKAQNNVLKELIKSYWRRNSSNKKSFRRSGHPKIFLNSNLSFEQFTSEIIETHYMANNFDNIVNDMNLKED